MLRQPPRIVPSQRRRAAALLILHHELLFGRHHTPDHPAVGAVLMDWKQYLELDTNRIRSTTPSRC